MVKIGKGKISDDKNTVVKELMMTFIENNEDINNIRNYFNCNSPKDLNNTRKMFMEKYTDKQSAIIFVSNNILEEIIEEIISQELGILYNHLKDLTKHNSELLQNLRDDRADQDLDKLINRYVEQHTMTKCGVKKGIYIASPDAIYAIIDKL